MALAQEQAVRRTRLVEATALQEPFLDPRFPKDRDGHPQILGQER
jgi:hypothetical protein